MELKIRQTYKEAKSGELIVIDEIVMVKHEGESEINGYVNYHRADYDGIGRNEYSEFIADFFERFEAI